MKIKLNEIPEEGREYKLTRETAELNNDLKDLIQDSPYDAVVRIKPLNTKNYEVKGFIKTSTKEQCSLCGETFKFKTHAQFNEILIPSSDVNYKNSHSRHSNHVSELEEDGPGVSEYNHDVFNLGEFVHEAIALTIPFNPKPDINPDDNSCTICDRVVQQEVFIYDEKMGEEKKPNNPFSSLKGLKLN